MDEEDNVSEAKSSTTQKNLKRSTDSENEVSPKKKKVDTPKITKNDEMPCIFEDKKFFISKNVEKPNEIKRYIIA